MEQIWTIRGDRPLGVGQDFGLLGIVNLSPDSFAQTESGLGPLDLLKRALTLRAQGADILDLGGESTRPGATPLDSEVEGFRLWPLLCRLRKEARGTILSLDTYHAKTAKLALEMGVDIINDISHACFEPELLEVLASTKPGYVLMHSKGRPKTMQKAPHYDDCVTEVLAFFEEQLNRLVKSGLPENRIVLDPGIGFGKNLAHNLALLKNIKRFTSLGRPLLVGLSYKQLFFDLLGLPLAQRGSITQVATALLWQQGVFWHRVHDVAKAREALTLAAQLKS